MIFLPAIDIRDGKAVRLEQGRFDKETVYVDTPLEAARSWVKEGARSLHIVDLDGAREGSPQNLDWLKRITNELRVPVQYGGGLRSIVSARDALAAGADARDAGDRRLQRPRVPRRGDRPVGRARRRRRRRARGHVSVSGWTKSTQMLPEDVIERMQRRGVKQFVYTNADRDGMLNGPDLDEVQRIGAVIRGRWIYSGGIGSLDDLQNLRDLRLMNLAGIISGKALYEHKFTVAEAHEVLDTTRERAA